MPVGEHPGGGMVAVRPGGHRVTAPECLRCEPTTQPLPAGVGGHRKVDLGAAAQGEALGPGQPHLRAVQAAVLEMELAGLVQWVVPVGVEARSAHRSDDRQGVRVL